MKIVVSLLHEQPFFTTYCAKATKVKKATKCFHRVRRLSNGLPFEASLTEAKNGGDEVGGFEDLKVAFGVVVALGAVDDGFGGGVPGDFLEGERMAEQIFRQTLATGGVVGGDGLFAAVVDIEA